jgi:hypothetical protein
MALQFMASCQQLVLVGAQGPVMTFAYQGLPVSKVPAGCTVTTLATVDHDIRAARGTYLQRASHALGVLCRRAT